MEVVTKHLGGVGRNGVEAFAAPCPGINASQRKGLTAPTAQGSGLTQ